MIILQVPPTSLILKPLQGKLLIEPFRCIFMGEETFIWTEILKNQEALLNFLRGQDAHNGSSECWPALNKIALLIIATPIKKELFHLLRATFPGEKFPRSRL